MLSDRTIRDYIDLIRPPLHRYVVSELKSARARAIHPEHDGARRSIEQSLMSLPEHRSDTLALCRLILDRWDLVFGRRWSEPERRMIQELRCVRNRHAHEREFSEQEIRDFADLCSELARTLGDLACAEACQALRRPGVAHREAEISPRLEAPTRSHPALAGLRPVYRSSLPPAVQTPQRRPDPAQIPTVVLDKPPIHSTISNPPLPGRDQGARLYASGEDLAEFFEALGWRTVDKRSKSGCLWVIGDDAELAEVIAGIALSHGIIFQPAPDGGRASNYEPAWFTTDPA
jgi:hypothetical protein